MIAKVVQWIGFVCLAWLGLVACGPSPNGKKWEGIALQKLRYAKGFKVVAKETHKEVWLRGSADSTFSLSFCVTDDPTKVVGKMVVPVLKTPILSLVCTSTTHVPHLDYLGETSALVGFPSTDLVSSQKMRARIDSGLVADVGQENALNLELILSINPGVVMTYAFNGEIGSAKKLPALGVPVIVNNEYLEQHPLGRAEWIKFTGLLFGKEALADSIFRSIEAEYNRLAAQVPRVTKKPTVMSGVPYGGIWYLPGGKNYGSRLLADAGIDYFWKDTPQEGSIQLTWEEMLSKAGNADFWIGVGSFTTFGELRTVDDRLQQFAPWKAKKMYSYTARLGARGGNEYMELGYLRPDLILNDLIQITHPEAYPAPKLFFFQRLK